MGKEAGRGTGRVAIIHCCSLVSICIHSLRMFWKALGMLKKGSIDRHIDFIVKHTWRISIFD